MLKQLFSSVILFFFMFPAFAQGSIMLLPFVGKDKSEVVMVYDTKTGKSVEWYYDEAEKKMKKAGAGFQLPANPGVTGNVMMKAYIGADGSEVILVWNTTTGQSVSWYYDEAEKKMLKNTDNYQLPQSIGLTGNIMMFPYIGSDGSEVVLCWETATGKSVSFYYDNAEKKFLKSTAQYQLPAATGVSGKVMMHPYIGKDGSEVVLVWDANSGRSVSWYYGNAEKRFLKATENYQLPSSPGVSGSVMMYPYIGSDKSEVVLVWSIINGASMMWYFDELEKRFIKAKSDFQLPTNTGISQNVMMVPFVEKNHDEVVYIWNSEAGNSVNFYFDDKDRKYIKSKPEFQLPANPLQ
ncbi:MAG: hypothetical protein KIS94_01100 [Chitinophagales bacterium]|nr:hypothetical protein [Chitinophagales bacterium]